MSNRAEQAAHKAYPYEGGGKGLICEVSIPIFIQGYEQAEKDLGWISVKDRLPEERKCESDNMQGHHEWTESERVLVWDSTYGPGVDWTRNGKWRSEQIGGYQPQICHGIIAWMPIPEFKED